MSKKSNPIEVLNPTRPAQDVHAGLETFIEQKIAEIMGGTDGVFEPFFQTKAVAQAIRKLETIPQQRKWQAYFERWGCLACRKKNRPHHSMGMCGNCYHKITARLQTVLRLTEEERKDGADSFTPNRLTDLARSAVTRRRLISADTQLRSELRKIVRSKRTGAALREELRKISCEPDTTDEETKKGEL